VNNTNTLLPNLWCLCSIYLSPTLLSADDQQISISFDVGGKIFGITLVYASTCYRKIRDLWSTISIIQNQHLMPWACIGDFNTILGSHEQRSSYSPARLAMEDFQQWTDTNNLIHMHTRGGAYTWSNGRRGRFNIQRRLDRVIVNEYWINSCTSSNVCTLTKVRSDHYPLLLEFMSLDIQFASTFKFLKMWVEHPDCINIVKQCWNNPIVGCPMYVLSQKLKVLKENLKSWNKNSLGNIHNRVSMAY